MQINLTLSLISLKLLSSPRKRLHSLTIEAFSHPKVSLFPGYLLTFVRMWQPEWRIHSPSAFQNTIDCLLTFQHAKPWENENGPKTIVTCERMLMWDEWGGNGTNGRRAFNEETIKFKEGFFQVCCLRDISWSLSSSGWKAQRANNELLSWKLLSNGYMGFFGLLPRPPTLLL